MSDRVKGPVIVDGRRPLLAVIKVGTRTPGARNAWCCGGSTTQHAGVTNQTDCESASFQIWDHDQFDGGTKTFTVPGNTKCRRFLYDDCDDSDYNPSSVGCQETCFDDDDSEADNWSFGTTSWALRDGTTTSVAMRDNDDSGYTTLSYQYGTFWGTPLQQTAGAVTVAVAMMTRTTGNL